MTNLVFSGDGRYLASASSNSRTVLVWDLKNRQKLAAIPTDSERIGVLEFGNDNRNLILLAGGTLSRIEIPSLKVLDKLFITDETKIQKAALSPNQQLLVTTFEEDGFSVWRTLDGRLLRKVPLPSGHASNVMRQVTAVAVSADNSLLAVGLTETTQLVDRVTDYFDVLKLSSDSGQKELMSTVIRPNTNATGNLGKIDTISFDPDGHTIVTGSYNGSVELWRVH